MNKDEITKELTQYNTTDAAIATKNAAYLPMTIETDGFDKVHAAKMDIKGCRVAVTKKGRELRDGAIVFQRQVLEEEKRILTLLAPIEAHLEEEEDRFKEEQERVKKEAQAKIDEMVRARGQRLTDLGCNCNGVEYYYKTTILPVTVLQEAKDEQFETFYNVFQDAIRRDAEAKAEEDRIRKEESDRLARVAAEQETERARLASEAKAIQDEKDRMAREKKAAEDAILEAERQKARDAELEKAKIEAAEKARIETEARIAREAKEQADREAAAEAARIQKEEAARIRAEKKASRLPDKERLAEYVDRCFDIEESPTLKTEEGITALKAINDILEDSEVQIRIILEAL